MRSWSIAAAVERMIAEQARRCRSLAVIACSQGAVVACLAFPVIAALLAAALLFMPFFALVEPCGMTLGRALAVSLS